MQYASFWKETLKELVSSVQSWWYWLAIFSFLHVGVSVLIDQLPWSKDNNLIADPAVIIISIIEKYILCVAYLRYASAPRSMIFNTRRFLLFSGTVLVKNAGFYVTQVGLQLTILYYENNFVVALIAIMLSGFFAIMWGILIWPRCAVIEPIAILGGPQVLKTSWVVTEGQKGRIVLGWIMLTLILSAPLTVWYFQYWLSIVTSHVQSVAYGLILPTLSNPALLAARSIESTLGTLASMVYSCTVYRILNDEMTAR